MAVTARSLVREFGKVQQNITAAGERAVAAYAQAMRAEAELILTAAKLEAPVDTGNLRASGYVDEKDRGGSTQLVIGFQAAYALPVHENLNAHHVVGKAKYLEDPLKAAMGGLPARVAQRVKAAMEGSGVTSTRKGGGGARRGGRKTRAGKAARRAAKRIGKKARRGARRAVKVARKAAGRTARRTSRAAGRVGKKAARHTKRATRRVSKVVKRAGRRASKSAARLGKRLRRMTRGRRR